MAIIMAIDSLSMALSLPTATTILMLLCTLAVCEQACAQAAFCDPF